MTTRRCVLRIDRRELQLPLSDLLARYVKGPDTSRLQAETRITADSADILDSLGDLVYASTDGGQLRDMLGGVRFIQGQNAIALEEVPTHQLVRVGNKDALLIDLIIDRTNVGYDRNWTGFNARRWSLRPGEYSAFVLESLEQACGPKRAQATLALESTEHKLTLVEVLARRIWRSDFENYSRFTGAQLVFKSGDETVRNIMGGSGGICSEKVLALKFLTDHYGLQSELVLAGADCPTPVPESGLREMLTTFDFSFSKGHMRYWQHTALLYHLDGTLVLVDDTNGNIPFLFVKDSEADRLLGYDSKPAVKVRMAVADEDFYYHRVSQDIPENLCFAMEGWIPYVDLVQVFDNELGLYISSGFMVAPAVFKTPRAYERLRRRYLAACGRADLPCSVSGEWDLDSHLGQSFAERHPDAVRKVLEARDHLLARYDDCHGPGHEAGLVIIGLQPRGIRGRSDAEAL